MIHTSQDITAGPPAEPFDKSTTFFSVERARAISLQALARFRASRWNSNNLSLTGAVLPEDWNFQPTEQAASNIAKEPEFPRFSRGEVSATQEPIVSLQKWEGCVIEIEEKSFYARLRDLTNPGTKEDAQFNVSGLSHDDIPLLKLGAVFYWSIGYHTDSTGRQRTVSEIRFRRLPTSTPEEYAEAALEAKKIAKLLGASHTRT